MAEKIYNVRAILSAQDNGFSVALKNASAQAKAISSAIRSSTSGMTRYASATNAASASVRKLSGTFSTAGSSAGRANSSFTASSSAIDKVRSSASSMGGVVKSSFRGMSDGANQAGDSGKSAGDKTKTGMDGAHKSIVKAGAAFGVVSSLAQSAFNVVKSSIGGAVSRVDTLNKFPRVMANFGYSAKESKTTIQQLSKGIQGLPTTLDDAASSAQAFSISTGSLSKGTKLALAFNNAMIGYGASAEGAKNAQIQFNQSLGSGKIQAEEFNSINEAAPGLMSKMAEAFGFGSKGVGKLKDALSTGQITAEQFSDKMLELNDGVGGFASLAQSSAGGIATSFTNIGSAVTRGMGNVIEAIDKGFGKAGLGSIATFMSSLVPMIYAGFNAIVPIVQRVTVGVIQAIQFLGRGFGQLYRIAAPYLSQFVSFVQSAFSMIGSVFGRLGRC